ncbi:MAG: MarR family transcriptional regulator [Bacillales bacterium]
MNAAVGELLKSLVEKYINLSFSVNKKGESIISAQIGRELTTDQHYVLRYINKVRKCTTTELAEVFDVKKSAITAIINRMWAKGLIKRTRDKKDRRIVYLTLTEEGKEIYRKTEERIRQVVETLIRQFDLEEIQQFLATYEKLNKVLTNYINERLGEEE